MKPQEVHSFPRLEPFLKLILALTLQREVETATNLQHPTGEAPDLSAAATAERLRGTKRAGHVVTRAFLALLLRSQGRGTSHHANSLTDRDWWQGRTAPRGAILVARYASR